ncbi:cytochrome b [Cylindrospermum sp. FACHB-282]|uniref:cytochrome b n=1 Tax=Cylindrospermum sp. FACHB-282 TaxID=2692794 RepID=UPI001681C8E6|nr:cytochrome b/b6 domain-containing protein [Cylindrospermum sp. FACHB-282]MBD2384983.1 cytochrome b/b6 domain-containing protein [Cylindrospermum sp. FACHB-282]
MTIAQQRPARKKSAAQRLWFLHWLMALFYLLIFVSGRVMVSFSDSFTYRETFYDFHKVLGAAVMSLLLGRISVLLLALRHKYRRRQPERKGDWLQTVALHTALYFFMLIVPLSGYFFSNSAGYEVKIFQTGLVLPRLFPTNKPLYDLAQSFHFWISYTFLAFIILHSVDQRKYLRAQMRRFSKALVSSK